MKVTTVIAMLLSTTHATDGDSSTAFTTSKECDGTAINAALGTAADVAACRGLCKAESDGQVDKLVCCQFNETGDGSAIDPASNTCGAYDGSNYYAKDKADEANTA